jgi:prepilin-type N-terminal cleavage/methylation domain-containing protein
MRRHSQVNTAGGFTLLEIMIVVAIIGILCSLAIPAFAKARLNSKVSAQMNDLRILDAAFQLYAMEHNGHFPAVNWTPGVLPAGMSPYVNGNIWSLPSPLGGLYAWVQHTDVNGITTCYIALTGNVDGQAWNLMDQEMDDGKSDSGQLQSMSPVYVYFLDQ